MLQCKNPFANVSTTKAKKEKRKKRKEKQEFLKYFRTYSLKLLMSLFCQNFN